MSWTSVIQWFSSRVQALCAHIWKQNFEFVSSEQRGLQRLVVIRFQNFWRFVQSYVRIGQSLPMATLPTEPVGLQQSIPSTFGRNNHIPMWSVSNVMQILAMRLWFFPERWRISTKKYATYARTLLVAVTTVWENQSLRSSNLRSLKNVSFAMLKVDKAWVYQTP